MALYTIADLHLSFATDKPMDIFGASWANHYQILEDNWRRIVGNDDTVVLIGDHSWGLRAEEAIPDLRFIDNLPGQKLLIKGNHDPWWSTLNKLREICIAEGFASLKFIQADAATVTDAFGTGYDAIICGTRGWTCVGDMEYKENHDCKIFRRETLRLEMALEKAVAQRQQCSENGRNSEIIVFIHYPPYARTKTGGESTPMTELIEKYGVRRCYYGHLHGLRAGSAPQYTQEGSCVYSLVSGDYVSFVPQRIVANDDV